MPERNRRRPQVAAALIFLSMLSAGARAEVTAAAENGFHIRVVTEVAADRGNVYRIAVEEVGSWWHSDHTMTGFAENLFIENRVPGCFCENLGEGARFAHMSVTWISPGSVLRLTGGLGPLGLMGVNGNMTWEFEEAGEGTRVTLKYAVGGFHADDEGKGLAAIAPAVDFVLTEAMTRLKTYVETGTPTPES